jgi:hypothetical protein
MAARQDVDDCARPGDSERAAEWLAAFCVAFGKLFANRYGEDPSWSWKFEHVFQPMVLITSGRDGIMLSQALPDGYYMHPASVVARQLWEELRIRIEAATTD